MNGNKLKIVLVGPGLMSIPPTGWGAIESVIWDLRGVLLDLGHTVHIINTVNKAQIIKEINEINPDFVHFHYEPTHSDILKYVNYPKAITSHNNYSHTKEKNMSMQNAIYNINKSNTFIFSLSKEIEKIYLEMSNIDQKKIFITPNGVSCRSFSVSNSPSKSEKSIFLGKVEPRKRQHLIKNVSSIDIVGPIADGYNFEATNYVGQISRELLYKNLTEYGNLVLLSKDEGQPLVCLEALAAGLGLVITKNAADNLDINLPFITIIDESMLNNKEYLIKTIEKNKKYSVKNRKDIINYAETFDWKNIVNNNYIPAIRSIIL